jgi:hypothetical protein
MEYKGVRRVLILNWVYDNDWRDKSQLYLDFRTKPVRFEPNSWNKLNDLERNEKYSEYMDWLGGINESNAYTGRYIDWLDGINESTGFTDNIEVMVPEKNDNLYKKLKAYILLCRRYRDRKKEVNRRQREGKKLTIEQRIKFLQITEQELQNHLLDLQKLVDDNFEEILNNLMITKWFTSIVMCFIELGTEKQKEFYKKIIKKLVLSKIDWKRGRTMFSEDKVTNENWFKKIKSEYKWKSINDID